MKNHDENQCVRILSNKCRLSIDSRTKTIRGSKNQVIGIKAWGRIDYLTNYCGYTFIWDNTVISKDTKSNPEEKKALNKSKKTIKKMRKDAEGNNKTNKKK